MLEATRTERDQKRDVVIGVVETHGRYDTGALVVGLELLARKKVHHKAVTLEEFDLDAALERKPGLILMDELAHTNAPGSRHAKRWQDVEELLDAGIDVYSTLNVQHIESLNDVVAQVSWSTSSASFSSPCDSDTVLRSAPRCSACSFSISSSCRRTSASPFRTQRPKASKRGDLSPPTSEATEITGITGTGAHRRPASFRLALVQGALPRPAPSGPAR
jgi:hypothetical protein